MQENTALQAGKGDRASARKNGLETHKKIAVPLERIRREADTFKPLPTLAMLKAVGLCAKENGIAIGEAERNTAAILIGSWFSSSKWHEIKQELPTILRSAKKPLAFQLFCSKAGKIASRENSPDLGDILFGLRLGKVSDEAIILDEFPVFGDRVWEEGNRAFKSKLASTFDSAGVRLDLRNMRVDGVRFASAIGNGFDKTELDRVLRPLERSTGRADAISAERFVAAMRSRIPFDESEALHVSVTRKEGRLNIGWSCGLLHLHGVPLVYEQTDGKINIQVRPEAELESCFGVLAKELEVSAIIDEKGEFLAYGITKGVLTEAKVLQGVSNAISKKAIDNSIKDLPNNIVENIGVSASVIKELDMRITA